MVSIIAGISGTRYSHEEMYVTLESDRFTGSGPYTPNVDNLMAYVELYDSDGLVVKLQSPYDYTDKRTIFDLSRLARVNYKLPTEGSIQPHGILPIDFDEAVGVVKDVYFKYGDKFGTPAAPEALLDSDTFYLVRGSRSANAGRGAAIAGVEAAPFVILHKYISDDHTTPWSKEISYNQPDWIYFFTTAAFDMEIGLTLHHEDGTDDVSVLHTITLEAQKVYWIQCGIPQINAIDIITNTDIYAYTISLKKDDQEVARTIQFMIDYTCQAWGDMIAYTNGVGGIETVHMKGRGEASRAVTSSGSEGAFRRTRWTDFSIQDGDYDRLTPEGSGVRTSRSGYYPKVQVEHMQQLLHADAWLIRNNKFEKILILSSQLRVSEDDANLYALELQYRIGTDDDAFTR